MNSTDERFFIEAFFEGFEKKIDRLPHLNDQRFHDEAKTLCLVYIDRLASGRYFDGQEANKRNFCRALRELSGDPFFGAIHPKKLLESVQNNASVKIGFAPPIEALLQKHPKVFFTENEVQHEFQNSPLLQEQKESFFKELWRASVAAICYEELRTSAVHGPGSIDASLSFSETSFQGKTEMKLTFEMLYKALQNIFKAVKDSSITTGRWFGNSLYK